MPSIHWLLLFALAAPGFAGQVSVPQPSEEEARVFKVFAARVHLYIKLQNAVEASLPALKPTSDVARIAEHQHALARKIAQARSGAHQGDIFTHEVTRHFLKTIRGEFQGPEAQNARRSILPDDPSKFTVRLRVNDIYPEDTELTTTPPALLSRLPQLPQELAYRIVGHDLVLKDTKAGLIVDLIPNAVP